jgi:predicted amidohydrolase YtcJ
MALNMGYEGGTEELVLGKIKAALLREDQLPYLHSNRILNGSNFLINGMLPKGFLPDRKMLDRLSKPLDSGDPFATGTTRPIRLSDADYHRYIVNSQALLNAGITAATPTPPGSFIGHYEDGEPNGQFSDYSPPAPFGQSLPMPPDSTYIKRLADIELYNQLGTTSIFIPGGSETNLLMWQRIANDGKLTMRVNQSITAGWVRGQTDPAVLQGRINAINALRDKYNGWSSPNSIGTLTVDTVKIFGDGVAEYPSQTAAMLLPYNINVGTPEVPIWVPGTLRGEDPTVDDATLGYVMIDANKWSIQTHAIGNRAVRETLNNCEAAQEANGVWDSRHNMIHVEFVDPADLSRWGELGVIPDMQLQWAGRDGYTVNGSDGFIDADLLAHAYPAGSLLKAGATLAGGSDYPVDPLEPWNQIATAVTRENQDNWARGKYPGTFNYKERLSLINALKMHTLGTAYQLHQDDVTGSIAVGKYADLIVLDQNLFKIPAMQIDQTNVVLTMLGGQFIWQDPNAQL